jgi:hypothetical protein
MELVDGESLGLGERFVTQVLAGNSGRTLFPLN